MNGLGAQCELVRDPGVLLFLGLNASGLGPTMPKLGIRTMMKRARSLFPVVGLLALLLPFVACGGSSSSSGGGGGNGGGGGSLTVTTTSLPVADIGQAYVVGLTSTGGNPPVTWSVKSGTLPPGLTLGPGGTISGIPTAVGSSVLVFEATDSSSPVVTANSASLTLQVVQPLAISTTSLPNGMVNQPYSAALQAIGGTAPYTWALTGTVGTLPPGITFSSNGTISGTTTQPGLYGSLVFTVTDAKGATATNGGAPLGINIAALPLMITTTSLPGGEVGQPYLGGLTSTGGTPPLTWSVKSGTLPAGLALGQGGGITGVPTTTGSSTLVFQATDSSSPQMVATSQSLTIQITPGPLTVTTTTLPNGTVNAPYSTTLQAAGGFPPYTWTFVPLSGPLPPGLTLNQSGTISGTPAKAGTYSTSYFVTDSQNNQAQSLSLSITINAAPLTVTTTALPSGNVGTAYSGQLMATGGATPYNWAITSGVLPAGLTLASNGLISGTPTVGGNSTLVFQVQDANQNTAKSGSLTIAIIGPNLIVTTTTLPSGIVGTPYSAMLAATGGAPPYTWSQTGGTLPTGLTLNSTSGIISGTPTTAQVATGLVFKVTDSNNVMASSGSLTITILNPPLSVITTSLPGGIEGTPYNANLQATGGVPPYTWTETAGPLPQGLFFNSNGTITGTPTKVQTASALIFQVTDSTNTTALSGSLSIQIVANTCGTGSEASLPANQPYAFLIKGFDADGPVSIAGSFITNGTGNITSGTEDINRASQNGGGTNLGIIPTGSFYNIGADNRGCLTLVNSAGTTTFRFALSGFNGGTTASSGRIIEFDDNAGTGTRGSGILRQQDTTAFSSGLGGASGSAMYAFQFTGGDASSGYFGIVGSLTASSGAFTNLAADSNDTGAIINTPPICGSSCGNYTGADPTTGRGTAVLAAPNVNFATVFYIVSANEVIYVTSDPISQNPIAGGEALLTAGPFAPNNLVNYFIYQSEGSAGGSSTATVGTIMFDGAATYAGEYFQNAGGASSGASAIPFSGYYTVDTNTGRIVFNDTTGLGEGAPPVGYLINDPSNPSVFLIGTDSLATSGSIEFQDGTGTVNFADLTGLLAMGTDNNGDNGTTNLSGSVNITNNNPNFVFAGTEDVSGPGAGGLAPNQTTTGTATFAGDGTGNFGTGTQAVTNGEEIYYISTSPTVTSPTVTVVVK